MVSIIIPFYNAENFLERAIISAINQSYTSIEVILINDGSNDGSEIIAKKYSDQHHNIRLFTTQNLGPGNARNIGIENSLGEFIIFLDSDDALGSESVKILADAICENESDIVVCKFTLYDKQQIGFKDAGWKLDSYKTTGKEAVKAMYSGRIASVVWAKIYRTEIINKILFPVGLWFEDRPYLMECFLNTDKISLVNDSLLKIYSQEDSITRRVVTKKRIEDLHLIYVIEMEMLGKYNNVHELSAYIINHHIDVLLDTFFLIIIDEKRMKHPEDQKKLYVDYIKKFMDHYPKYPYQISIKRKIILLILNGLRVFPWSWVVFFGCILLKKKYNGVKLLKKS